MQAIISVFEFPPKESLRILGEKKDNIYWHKFHLELDINDSHEYFNNVPCDFGISVRYVRAFPLGVTQ